jgi:hypothetical protein
VGIVDTDPERALLTVWRAQVVLAIREVSDNVLGNGIVAVSNLPAQQHVIVDPAPSQTTASQVVSALGDTTLHTPALGKKIVLAWAFMSSSQDNSAEVLAQIKLGTRVIYSAYLGSPGAFSHRETITADNVNDALVLNLSAAGQNVAVNWTLSEV